MKAIITGDDYDIYLKTEEIALIEGKSRLEAELIDGQTNQALGKKVSLKFTESAENQDGIDLSYSPENRQGWNDIQEINVALSQFALDSLKEAGHFGTRYGLGDKICFFDESSKHSRRFW